MRKVLRGSASNIVRLAFTTLASLVVPPILTHQLAPAEYSIWVLILQLSTYVALLDLGLQTVVARFVAEHDARGDRLAGARMLSSAVSILLAGAFLGIALVVLIASNMRWAFVELPATHVGEAQLSFLLVGITTALSLPFGPFLAAFNGFQSYGFPTGLVVVSRLASATAMVLAVLAGGGLVALAAVLAATNVLTGLAQYAGWRVALRHRFVSQRVRPSWITVKGLLATGGVIALWSVSGLFVNGLDTVIVGRFDFGHTGSFALAATAVNFLLLIVGSLFSPLLPAIAAIQGSDAGDRIALLVTSTTRYCAVALLLLAMPLFVFAHPLLELWVGEAYADRGAVFMQLLLIGNCVRQVGYPYAMAVVARGKQVYATVATLSEAVANFTISILLVQVIGAAGVAVGTIAGAVLSLALHFLVSMPLTRDAIPVVRRRLLLDGLLRPSAGLVALLIVLPGFVLGAPVSAGVPRLAVAGVVVVVVVVLVSLTSSDRLRARRLLSNRPWGAARA